MKKFNTFVRYHGCNISYKDGTRQIIFKTCSRPTYKPFWKNPEHVPSRVVKSRRAQLKNSTQRSSDFFLTAQNFKLFG